MTSNVQDLNKALLQGVVDCALGMPIAQVNAHFDKPTDGSPWAAVFILPNQPSVATMGQGGQDAHDGIMQIDLNYQVDSGEAATQAKVKDVTAFFRAGRALVYSGTTAYVASCGKPRSAPVDGWYRTSLTIEWYARVDR